jgi:hypothetical protein
MAEYEELVFASTVQGPTAAKLFTDRNTKDWDVEGYCIPGANALPHID